MFGRGSMGSQFGRSLKSCKSSSTLNKKQDEERLEFEIDSTFPKESLPKIFMHLQKLSMHFDLNHLQNPREHHQVQRRLEERKKLSLSGDKDFEGLEEILY
jgi:hypothetical protein